MIAYDIQNPRLMASQNLAQRGLLSTVTKADKDGGLR